MSKESHVVRVWARHGGHRVLEFSLDAPNARRLALLRVHALESDPTVGEIEMREHAVLTEDLDETAGMHRTLRWMRTDGRWRRLPDRDTRSHLGRWPPAAHA